MKVWVVERKGGEWALVEHKGARRVAHVSGPTNVPRVVAEWLEGGPLPLWSVARPVYEL